MRYEFTFQPTFLQKAGRLWFPLLLVFALLASAPVPAGEVHGTAVADQVQRRGAGSALVLNGAGVRVMGLFSVYLAALYLPAASSDGESILRARAPSHLNFLLRSITNEQVKSAITGALRDALTPAQVAPLASRMQQIDDIIAGLDGLKKGATLSLSYQPDAGTRIEVNGADKGLIPGADLNEALMRIWIGDRPRDPRLRRALLGLDAGDTAAAATNRLAP